MKQEPPPIDSKWSPLFQSFVSACLTKDPSQRPSAAELLEHEFLRGAENHKKDFAKVVKQHIEVKQARRKRKLQQA